MSNDILDLIPEYSTMYDDLQSDEDDDTYVHPEQDEGIVDRE